MGRGGPEGVKREHMLVKRGPEGQDPLAIKTDLKSVTSSELLNLAILFQKSH